ncbi:MAG: type II toxin-antitoxin system HipA family toxin [Campylobacter sp.]|nr:type II toxin-antitoxin system HipA family toxin [Campylobacter sp.]
MKNFFEIYANESKVGELKIFGTNANKTYSFAYDENWLKFGFELDPNLPLCGGEFVSQNLWGAFCDISPDRWGRFIQDLGVKSEYLLGVNDALRQGALRIKNDKEFISQIPQKNINLDELCQMAFDLESGANQDFSPLIACAGSLGGARPKAGVVINNEPFIIKFPLAKERHCSKFEQTMLETAKIAKINVCETRLYESKNGTALLIKRFDRQGEKRLAYKSAMTLLGIKEGQKSQASYVDLALLLDSKNKKELFRRMLFNGFFGNSDDHLKNHGVLYDEKNQIWNLSPAFDITPELISYEKQSHALNFIDLQNKASIKLFDEIKEFFDINSAQFKEILSDMLVAMNSFEKIAKKNGINNANLKILKNNYDFWALKISKFVI